MNNQPFAWGPLLCKMQVEDSVLDDLLWETKRGDEEYNAEANLVATMHDEWSFAPKLSIGFKDQSQNMFKLICIL